jgi:hypothetical protein
VETPPLDQQTPEALGASSKSRNREVVADNQGGRDQGPVLDTEARKI